MKPHARNKKCKITNTRRKSLLIDRRGAQTTAKAYPIHRIRQKLDYRQELPNSANPADSLKRDYFSCFTCSVRSPGNDTKSKTN